MIKQMLFMLSAAPIFLFGQNAIIIDGNFDEWANVSTVVVDPPNDEHDTDWYGDGLSQPVPRKYSDVDILEVRFTHDRENLFGYVKARGIVGRTSKSADGQKAGRYYYIITIDMDNNDSTGYPLQQGNYWPNSEGYDMNMEVEFYDGAFNTGHYIHHGFLSEAALAQGRVDLQNRIIRLAPGNYDDYLQWVVFEDSSIVEVEDRGPVYQGIIEVAVSEDGREAEMKAPMWGFFWDENGEPICKLGATIDISFSLEGSGELSESAAELGYDGSQSVWGSDTAEPIEGYVLEDIWTSVKDQELSSPKSFVLKQNYPNPFNPSTTVEFELAEPETAILSVFDSRGRLVHTLYSGALAAGVHSMNWDGRDLAGRDAATGLYFARLTVGKRTETIKMLLVR